MEYRYVVPTSRASFSSAASRVPSAPSAQTSSVPPSSRARPRRARVSVMDCVFDAISVAEVLEFVFAWRSAPLRTTHTIVTVNVAILMMMRDDAALSDATERADVVVADGKPLVWTSRWLRSPVPEKVAGVDLMARLLEEGERRGLSVYLLGTTQQRLDALQCVLRAKYPHVRIVGARSGFFSPSESAEVVRGIREARADVLFVGMPAPFKEVWCEAHRDELETPAILGVGGAFDVLGGFVPRAPRIMQEAGLEWAWRLAMEPRKLWRRYLVTNTRFLALLPRAILEARGPARTA